MRILAIITGRFHPVHPGHVSSFNQLSKTFGKNNTVMSFSRKVEEPKSPFKVTDRVKMAMLLGIPRTNIMSVSQPYKTKEYIDKFNLDPNHDVIVFGVSKKDMLNDPRFKFEPNSDGSPSYLQPYPKDGKNLQPISKHAYIVVTESQPFTINNKKIFNARDIRKMYSKANDNEKNNILYQLYGKNYRLVKPIFDNTSLSESINRKELIKLIIESKDILKKAPIDKKYKLLATIKEAYKKIVKSTNNDDNLKLIEQDLIKMGVCLWPSDNNIIPESLIKIYQNHGRYIKIIMENYYFRDESNNENIIKMIDIRNRERECNYFIKQQIVENKEDTQLNNIVDNIKEYSTDINRIKIGDKISIIECKIYNFANNKEIVLTGFRTPKMVIELDNYYIYFDDNTVWPNVKDYIDHRVGKITCFIAGKNDEIQNKILQLETYCGLNPKEDSNWGIINYIDKEEPLDYNIKESIDYIEENVDIDKLFPSKETMGKIKDNVVIYKMKNVGKTTGQIIGNRVEFVTVDGHYGYLPLDSVSIRKKF